VRQQCVQFVGVPAASLETISATRCKYKNNGAAQPCHRSTMLVADMIMDGTIPFLNCTISAKMEIAISAEV
jgi:hypothetical protein